MACSQVQSGSILQAESASHDTSVSDEDSDRTPNEPPDISPVSDGSGSDPVVSNSHTITSQDFAAKTGAVNLQVPAPVKSSQAVVPTRAATDDDSLQNGEHSNSDIETTNNIDEVENVDTLQTAEVSHEEAAVAVQPDSATERNDVEDLVNFLSLNELSQNISDEVKFYSNEVALKWEKRKGGASWTMDAESVLKDYLDKISIAQSANNSACVQKDLENYASRSEALKAVVESCQTSLNRVDWNKLQELTVVTLNEISIIVQEATASIENVLKEDPNYSSQMVAIELDGKEKLKQLYSNELKSKLSTLKDSAILGDESEYASCLEDKPEKGMIVDTLNDIMRIKNNCVG